MITIIDSGSSELTNMKSCLILNSEIEDQDMPESRKSVLYRSDSLNNSTRKLVLHSDSFARQNYSDTDRLILCPEIRL